MTYLNETKRIKIRYFNEEDLNNLYDYAKNKNVSEPAGWKFHESLDESKIVLEKFIRQNEIAIIYNNKVIGSIGHFKPIKEDLDGIEISYSIHQDYWGLGLMSEALILAIKHLFEIYNINNIYCCSFKDNIKSSKVCQKVGFKYLCEYLYDATYNNISHMVNYYILRKEDFFMNMREKKIDGELIFDGVVVKVEKDRVLCPNGNVSYREIVRHNGGAAILCITPNDEIILEKQFRYAYDEVIYEIPAGKLELGEDPYEAALRELEEETGKKASKLELLNVIYPTCGYSSEKIYLYLATDYVETKTHLDEDEVIEIELVPFEKAVEMINNGQIQDAKTICAITTYLIRYKR